VLVPWDVGQAADQAIDLIRNEASRERLVESVVSAGKQYTWKAAASGLLDLYREAADAPARASTPATISNVGIQLVGPDGLLPDEVQQALWALSIKPRLRRPIFGGLTLMHRIMRRARVGVRGRSWS
jgi:hypothetical protein